MCGIIAYVGSREVRPILLDGLARLEYRGYDSAGIATMADGRIDIQKRVGRIAELASHLSKGVHAPAFQGIGHTRWATHGEPNNANAHPHADASGELVIVHNGVMENFQSLKQILEAEGHLFLSATDTEVLAHLIGEAYKNSVELGSRRLVDAVVTALKEINGTYGIGVIHKAHPGVIIGARKGSPLVLGLGTDGMFLSSDATALLPYTQRVVYLKDYDLVEITADQFHIESMTQGTCDFEIEQLNCPPAAAERGTYAHYMLKEIHEQPQTLKNTLRGRLNVEDESAQLGGLNLTASELRAIDRIIILGCGTALHAGFVGAQMLENEAYIAAETDYASEFRFRNRPMPRNTLFLAVSQSGETADTLGAMREAQRKGFRCLGICNSVASSIARGSDGGMYMHAGPEIGVAATKSFVSQCTLFALLALRLGRIRQMSADTGHKIVQALEKLPGQISRILETEQTIRSLAQKYSNVKSMLFLGRQYNYPIALEAALKLKEISYIHAAGFPAGELKHGIIALIDENTPSVVICPQDSLYEKNISTIQEIKARKGPVIAVATEGDAEIRHHIDDVIYVPRTLDMLQPILNIIPLQLLAYHMAVALGRDVDKPRNLAKSVTVE